MAEYRAGQRVRIEEDTWAVEGVLRDGPMGRLFVDAPGDEFAWPIDAWAAGRGTVTILSEPRPEEPAGLGAVVMAGSSRPSHEERPDRETWVRFRAAGLMALPEWCSEDGICARYWFELADPVVLSEGWTPDDETRP